MTRRYAVALAVLLALSTELTVFASHPTPGPIAPDVDYFGAIAWELPDDARKMVVESVHDGDSLRLSRPNDDWWDAYRIIGIQAPELDGPWTDEECFGPEAAEFLKQLLPEGTGVYIQRDITDKDRNGRFLRHIFVLDDETEDAYLLSEVLVLGGYAKARSYPPNDLYDDVLAQAQAIADKENAGLWGTCAAWRHTIAVHREKRSERENDLCARGAVEGNRVGTLGSLRIDFSRRTGERDGKPHRAHLPATS